MPTTTSNITLAVIATEKTRVSERIAKLQTELAELDAAERVMTRYGGKTAGSKAGTTPAPTSSTRRRGRPAKTATATTTAPAGKPRRSGTSTGIKLGEACRNVVAKYPSGCSTPQITAGLKVDYGLTPRPNHLGVALQRERRGGRLESRDGAWYMPGAMAKAA